MLRDAPRAAYLIPFDLRVRFDLSSEQKLTIFCDRLSQSIAAARSVCSRVREPLYLKSRDRKSVRELRNANLSIVYVYIAMPCRNIHSLDD